GWSQRSSRHPSVWRLAVLAIEALRRALVQGEPSGGLLHHTDRGSPHASGAYQALLAAHGIVPSMSRRGDCQRKSPTGSIGIAV
ncbi:MAG: DDE-type integrase/transposase/recombinase, partial [Myxococcota bacterium]